MFRPLLIPDLGDDVRFCDTITQLIRGAIATHKPEEVRIFKIDNWFDHKWLRFSGTIVQHVAVWKDETTLPPFVPNRVVWQGQYLKEEQDGEYFFNGSGPPIHRQGPSTANLFRRVADIVPEVGLFWFSGNSLANGRGSLMGYLPIKAEKLWCWYVALERADPWKVTRLHNIQEHELRQFEMAGRLVPDA